jgi:metal-dependent amidase/aminoacylase/carboxypeptidase family protein
VIDRIKQLAAELHPELVRVRRHLHANPELSFQEKSTAAFVAGRLKAMGVEVREALRAPV